MWGNIRETFIDYLIEHKDSLYNNRWVDNPVWDYTTRIDQVVYWEGYSSWDEVATNIKTLVVDYDTGGVKEDYGRTGHYVVRLALKLFDEFCDEINLVKQQMVDTFLKEDKISPKLVVSPNNSAIRVGDTVVWHDLEDNEDIEKMIVVGSAGAGEISCDVELAKESIGKEVGDIITVNNYKYEIKQIIRQEGEKNMGITKGENANGGKKSVCRRNFEVLYYNSLMISEESFEAIKKSDLVKEDDEGVIYFPNIIKNMVWFVWFEKIEHNSKIYYEIARVKYVLPDNYTAGWIDADFGPLSRQLGFMLFSILNGCVKTKTNHDMEDCYIRDYKKGDITFVKMEKWDSYTSLLPALGSIYVTCVFTEDTNKRLDYKDLKNCT